MRLPRKLFKQADPSRMGACLLFFHFFSLRIQSSQWRWSCCLVHHPQTSTAAWMAEKMDGKSQVSDSIVEPLNPSRLTISGFSLHRKGIPGLVKAKHIRFLLPPSTVGISGNRNSLTDASSENVKTFNYMMKKGCSEQVSQFLLGSFYLEVLLFTPLWKHIVIVVKRTGIAEARNDDIISLSSQEEHGVSNQKRESQARPAGSQTVGFPTCTAAMFRQAPHPPECSEGD